MVISEVIAKPNFKGITKVPDMGNFNALREVQAIKPTLQQPACNGIAAR